MEETRLGADTEQHRSRLVRADALADLRAPPPNASMRSKERLGRPSKCLTTESLTNRS